MFHRLFSGLKTASPETQKTSGIYWTLPGLIGLKRYASRQQYRTTGTSRAPGSYHSLRKGRGMDFTEVRHYQAGDEIRHMEWRVTAKTGKPHIKLYEEERERPVILVVDFSPSMYFGTKIAFKSYVAAELAGLIAWHANMAGDKVGALIYGNDSHDELTPKTREAGVLPLLKLLHEYTLDYQKQRQKDKKENMLHALIRLRHVVKPGSLIILISDFYTLSPPAVQQLMRLRQHNEIYAYHINDPLEMKAPAPGIYPMTDTRTTIWINTTDPYFSQAYDETCAGHIHQIKDTFQKLSIPHVHVTASTELCPLTRQMFVRSSHA